MTNLLSIAQGWQRGRVDRLRAFLSDQGLDGMLVPRWDEQQFEYVPPRNERLGFMTGFSGSWGMGLLLAEELILFVDGRYTIQATNETDDQVVTICHLYDCPPEVWLKENANSPLRIGYDPEIMTPEFMGRLMSATQSREIDFLPISEDPFEKAWPDRPQGSDAPAEIVTGDWAGETAQDKISRLIQHLEATEIDWHVECMPDNVNWLLNLRGNDLSYCPVVCGRLVVGRAAGQVHLFGDEAQFDSAGSYLEDIGVTLHPASAMQSFLEECIASGDRVQIDPLQGTQCAVSIAERKEAVVELRTSALTEMKAIKNSRELETLAEVTLRDSAVWAELLCWLEKEVCAGNKPTEWSVEEKFTALRSRHDDYHSESFRMISAADGNAAMAHYAAPIGAGAHITEDSVYLLDSGAQFRAGGTTDTTRTWCFNPPSAEILRDATLALKGHIALARQVFPSGTTGHALDAVARSPIWAGQRDYDHGTGHGVGHFLSVHEFPQRLQKAASPFAMKPGMVITNEPGLYREGQYGIRHEIVYEIYETALGWMAFKPLAFIPFNQQLIDFTLLTEDEIHWVNEYHAQVFQKINSLTDNPEVQAWLKEATQPYTQ